MIHPELRVVLENVQAETNLSLPLHICVADTNAFRSQAICHKFILSCATCSLSQQVYIDQDDPTLCGCACCWNLICSYMENSETAVRIMLTCSLFSVERSELIYISGII